MSGLIQSLWFSSNHERSLCATIAVSFPWRARIDRRARQGAKEVMKSRLEIVWVRIEAGAKWYSELKRDMHRSICSVSALKFILVIE